jgi:hypothetical protein
MPRKARRRLPAIVGKLRQLADTNPNKSHALLTAAANLERTIECLNTQPDNYKNLGAYRSALTVYKVCTGNDWHEPL